MDKNSKIHAAASELFEANSKRPTIAEVREFIGSGSFSTITKAMQSWQQPGAAAPVQQEPEAEQQAQGKEIFDPNTVPEALQQSVMTAVQQVWITAKLEADQRIAQIQAASVAQAEALQAAAATAAATAEAEAEAMEAEHQAVVDELCSEVDRHEAEAEEKAVAITKMQEDIEGLSERINFKIDALEVATAQIKELNRQLKEKDAAIDEIKQKSEALNNKNEKLNIDLATAKATTEAAEKATMAAIKKVDKLQEENTKTIERAAKAEGRITELEKQLKAITEKQKDNK